VFYASRIANRLTKKETTMKSVYVISIFCTLLFLSITGSALADETYGPGVYDDECASMPDPDLCCDRAADEATRVETARSILRVHARTVGNPPVAEDDSHYHIAINGWAVNGSGEDLYSSEDIPAVYQESSLSNLTRQQMFDYLDAIFAWSSDMELVIYDEVWETHPDDSMTYMLLNKWFGSTDAGYYEQPGISIVKFRPGEGCASYQRDYFSEGDTYWGMGFAQPMVRDKRNTVITGLGLTGKCVDDDGDGYTKYAAATGCLGGTSLDCDDFHADINPGATEIPGNGLDDDCDPSTSDRLLWDTPASVIHAEYKEPSDITNHLLLLCLPFGAVLFLRGRRRRK
jgi:hypothetical protein